MNSKQGVLLYVQIDHLNGETIGPIIEMFYSSGASNVNVINSITKKNRPGYIIFIDCLPDNLETLESILARELGVSGWHRINTLHKYLAIQYVKRNIIVFFDNGQFEFTAEGKVINDDYINIRPENQNCLSLKKRLEKAGITLSLTEIYQRLYQVLMAEDQTVINLTKH
jgi:uncharacterized protein (DUF111 family)